MGTECQFGTMIKLWRWMGVMANTAFWMYFSLFLRERDRESKQGRGRERERERERERIPSRLRTAGIARAGLELTSHEIMTL